MTDTQVTAGQILVGALERSGVERCFGVPGESFLGILDALHDSSVEFISTRHEGGAAFMACAHAAITGQLGVCLGTRAVGTANLSIGVHNARQESLPLLAVAGGVNRPFAGREAFQEADVVAAMRPFTKWAAEVPSADRTAEYVARALGVATSGRPGPVFLSVPQDVCAEFTDLPVIAATSVSRPEPEQAAIEAALDALLEAERPLILAGGGVLRSPGASDLLVAFAEAVEVPVITSWRRHDVMANDHRLFLGSASLGAAAMVWERLGTSDVILVLGNRLQEPSTQGYRIPHPASRLVQIDIEPRLLPTGRQPDVVIQADAASALRSLLLAASRSNPVTGERRRRNEVDRLEFEASSEIPDPVVGVGVSYPAVLRALGAELPRDAVIASDAGNFYGWLSRHYRFSGPGTYLGPASGAMGYGLPAAIAARLARPNTPVVSVSGDGGFLMTLAELETAVRYGVAVVVLVLDNARHGTIRMHQEREYPGRVVGTELGVTDLTMVARGLGAEGHLVERDEQVQPVLRAALASNRPSVIQLRMDRDQLSVDRRLDGTGV